MNYLFNSQCTGHEQRFANVPHDRPSKPSWNFQNDKGRYAKHTGTFKVYSIFRNSAFCLQEKKERSFLYKSVKTLRLLILRLSQSEKSFGKEYIMIHGQSGSNISDSRKYWRISNHLLSSYELLKREPDIQQRCSCMRCIIYYLLIVFVGFTTSIFLVSNTRFTSCQLMPNLRCLVQRKLYISYLKAGISIHRLPRKMCTPASISVGILQKHQRLYKWAA